MTERTLRAISTDTLGGIQAITASISSESQRLTALENTVTNALVVITGQLNSLQISQAERQAIVSSMGTLQTSISDVQAALNQLRESVG